ncbi:hypothetical protein BLOT_005194 [Blomia tropicalis]|nr:hypothetical protein BLOT_005194 [Blomia tropicalis]
MIQDVDCNRKLENTLQRSQQTKFKNEYLIQGKKHCTNMSKSVWSLETSGSLNSIIGCMYG